MAQCLVTRRVHFCAAHRLHNPAKSDEWNRATFGLCNNPNYHGHNYELVITVSGEIDPDTGYVVNADTIKELADRYILGALDHKNINVEVPWFATRIASAENLAIFCWEQLASRIPSGTLTSIGLWENAVNYVEYRGA